MRNLSNLSSVPDPLPMTVHLPRDYFVVRGMRMESAGDLHIAADSYWGYLITIIGRSHKLVETPGLGPAITRTIIVESGAWICSGSLLHSCHIGEGSIVAAGTVVRGQTVGPGVIVAGNPARVIARWRKEEGRWKYINNYPKFLE